MKVKSILKIAVVGMAAFGAYAFSGNNANKLTYSRIDNCKNISAECDLNGDAICMIKINGVDLPVFDTECKTEIRHSNSIPVQWNDLPNQ